MRALSTAAAELMSSTVRQPQWRVECWDILSSGAPTLAQIIAGTATSATHPTYYLDATDFVADGMSWEAPGDKRADRLSLSLWAYTNRFHPDVGADAKFFLIGQVVRLIEGDATLEAADWVTRFTGHIRGQVGFTEDRQALRYETQVVAYGRRATPLFLKQKFTSATYGKATEYGTICQEIAIDQMHLAAAEMDRFPTSLGKVTQFASNSIVDLTALEAIDKILETVGLVSDFDGAGILRAYSRDVRRGADKVLNDRALMFSYAVNQQEIEAYNSVSVTGLDKNITEVEQPEQALARALVPVGFWRPTHTIHVQWSENHSLRARRTRLKILTSITDAIMFDLGSEAYEEESEFGGVIRVEITDFLLTLLVLIAALSVGAFLVPDPVVVGGVGASTGSTVPWSGGSLIQGALLTLITFTLSIQSSGNYEIWGVPVLPIYRELSAVVTRTAVPDYLLHQKELTNDWLNTVEELTEVAKLELYFEVSQESPREVILLDQFDLEIGDLLQIPIPGGNPVKLWIDSLSKTYGRETMPLLRIVGHKCLEGV